MLILDNVTLAIIDGVGRREAVKPLIISSNGVVYSEIKILSPTTFDNIPDKILQVKIPKLSYQEWGDFCIFELYKYINTKYVLLIHEDGFVINPQKWDPKFLDYDYIGAPWIYPDHFFTQWVHDHVRQKSPDNINRVGNGGFTFRTKKLLEVASTCPAKNTGPEDVYICMNNYEYFIDHGLKFAPVDIANKFSQDPLINPHSTFGFHGDRNYINEYHI